MTAPQIDPLILGEAADWLVHLHSGTATAKDRQAIQQWRGRSAEHALAWQRAEALLGDLRTVPGQIAAQTLQQVERRSVGRRRLLGRLGLVLLGGPVAWAAWQQQPWQSWTADLHTATGEQRTLSLPDGTRITLNTASALNLAFTQAERKVRLVQGEVLISTASDTARPFVVETPQGSAQAMGTRFSVRLLADRSQVSVLEGAVRLAPHSSGERLLLQAGQAGAFATARLWPGEPLDTSATAWTHGMLVAKDMPLGALLAELGRYRVGVLRCDPAVAQLSVSGAFSVRDTDASLALLQDTLPVHISALTAYWVTVQARG